LIITQAWLYYFQQLRIILQIKYILKFFSGNAKITSTSESQTKNMSNPEVSKLYVNKHQKIDYQEQIASSKSPSLLEHDQEITLS
jgi:hypothetical protein